MKEASRPPSSLPPTAATGAAAPLRILCVSSRRALGLRELRHALAEGVRPVLVVRSPYFSLNAAMLQRRPRSFLHFLAAFSLASCCSALSSAACNFFAVAETHLPKAFALFLFAPYWALKRQPHRSFRCALALLGGVLAQRTDLARRRCCPGSPACPCPAGGTARAAGTARLRNAATTISVRVMAGLISVEGERSGRT